MFWKTLLKVGCYSLVISMNSLSYHRISSSNALRNHITHYAHLDTSPGTRSTLDRVVLLRRIINAR